MESHRRELTGYCYRMLGSGFEAEDAVQETMVRAWKAYDRFEGRSSLRSWLYRIATNVCLDMASGPQRRARPMDLGPGSTADGFLAPGLPEHHWVQPVADGRVIPEGDPAEVAAARDTIRLAFVAALQHLPPKQRAVLILREVLRWHADEVAELLDTTVVSVNSALQRARATLAAVKPDEEHQRAPIDADQKELLSRYVAAFERYDVETLVALLHEDAIQSMPPFALWLRGAREIGRWMLGQGSGCNGSRALTTRANGCAALAVYRPNAPDGSDGPGTHHPFAIQVIESSGGKVSAIHAFLYPELFEAFGLPAYLG